MSSESALPSRTHLRAPRENGQALIEPPRSELPVLLKNFGATAGSPSSARCELIQIAITFTSQYRDVSSPPDGPLLLSGHQPELFHPGVWFKNFLLSSLARETNSVAINLIVDNDTIGTASISAPIGPRDAPRLEAVAYDKTSLEMPFEDRRVLDRPVFDSFANRVEQTGGDWLREPLVRELWPLAISAAGQTGNLGLAIAQARHQLEGAWGLQTLEVPLSMVFQQSAAREFMGRLLLDAANFAQVYNESLADYRHINHSRSRAHPVPDLANENLWQEVPLWIWSSQEPRRRHLFVKQVGSELRLTNRGGLEATLPVQNGQVSLAAWDEIELRGIRIRPRALITTMFARLVLSDLFLHGIGGAKYDEVTDVIIRRYFHQEPPRYVTATATMQLPIDFERITHGDVLNVRRMLRDLAYHGETSSHEHDAEFTRMAAHKRRLLREVPMRGAKKSWHREITAANEALHLHLARERESLERELTRTMELQRQARLLGSREFSFCLFPAENISRALLDLSAPLA